MLVFYDNAETSKKLTGRRDAPTLPHERAESLASKASINGRLTIGRTDVLQTIQDNLMES